MCKGRSQKNRSFWEMFPKYEWVGWLIPKPSTSPSKKSHPENRLFWLEFHLSCSQISQKPWSGWVGSQIWKNFPKKAFFGGDLSLCVWVNKFFSTCQDRILELESLFNTDISVISVTLRTLCCPHLFNGKLHRELPNNCPQPSVAIHERCCRGFSHLKWLILLKAGGSQLWQGVKKFHWRYTWTKSDGLTIGHVIMIIYCNVWITSLKSNQI